jgi:hypothetical protein
MCCELVAPAIENEPFPNESSGKTHHDRIVKNNSAAVAFVAVDLSSRSEKNSPP